MSTLPAVFSQAAALPAARVLAALVLPHVAYSAFLPELVLVATGLVLLVLSSLTATRPPAGAYAVVTVIGALASVATAYPLWRHVTSRAGGYQAVAGAVVVDGFSVYVMVLVGLVVAVAALMIERYLVRRGMEGPEAYVLALISGAGAVLMASANDLIVVFLGLEVLSLPLYVLAALDARRRESGEAGIKYFVLGAFSSAIFVYGIALTYGATGSTNLAQIASFLARNDLSSSGVLLAGQALMLVGFAFKVSAVPFHSWAPDVYQGSPSPATGFMAAIAKMGGFAGMIRVFESSFELVRSDWQPVVVVIAVATLVVGAALAAVQSDVKRMLAYSSVSHAGFIMVGFAIATRQGVAASLYYLFAYSFLILGSFAVVTVVGGRGDTNHDIATYRGLSASRPVLALAFTVLLLAQAGVPFTTGFIAKFYVITATASAHSYLLGLVAMVAAVIAAFFYLRVVFYMYSAGPEPAPAGLPVVGAPVPAFPASAEPVAGGDPGAEGAEPGGPGASLLLLEGPVARSAAVPERLGASMTVAIGICVVVTLVLGVWPAPLVDFARHATLLY
ncbi:MAG: NADH-quinone oxidoreductase subunit N [Acidimicrobiales bacterium]